MREYARRRNPTVSPERVVAVRAWKSAHLPPRTSSWCMTSDSIRLPSQAPRSIGCPRVIARTALSVSVPALPMDVETHRAIPTAIFFRSHTPFGGPGIFLPRSHAEPQPSCPTPIGNPRTMCRRFGWSPNEAAEPPRSSFCTELNSNLGSLARVIY
jgi:hypothetical protein